MNLQDLLRGVDVLELHADPLTEITMVAYDSRKVQEGALFAAISGFSADGNRFIPMAMEKGAAAVVTAKKPEENVPSVLVASDRLALAKISCNFYGNPAESMKIIGVTGTNGKTSVTLLLKSVLEKTLGAKVGLVGTMGNLIGDQALPTERTTPESLELQALFAKMRDAGCGYVVMEVSSHAVTLERIGGVHYDVAAFTNLTEDHLDFHKTMDAYCDAKAELFRRCDAAVINGDDSYAARIRRGRSGLRSFRPGTSRSLGKGCGASRGRNFLYGCQSGGIRCGACVHPRPLYGLQCSDGHGDCRSSGHFPEGLRPGAGICVRCERPYRGGSYAGNALYRTDRLCPHT